LAKPQASKAPPSIEQTTKLSAAAIMMMSPLAHRTRSKFPAAVLIRT